MKKYLLLTGAALLLISGAAQAHEDKVYCADKDTTVEMAGCLQNHYEEAEKEREAAEEVAKQQAAEYEEISKKTGSVQYEGLIEATEKSRAAFEEYRNRECARTQISYGAGTMAAIAIPASMVKLTEQRIEQLSNHE